MRNYKLLGIILIVGTLFQTACATQKLTETAANMRENESEMLNKPDSKNKTPVLVELFTSEG